MTKRCMCCSRDFPADAGQCYQCNLPLYNTADLPVMQEMDLNRILVLLMRRHDSIVKGLKCKPVVRLEKPVEGVARRLLRSVIAV